MQTMILVLVSVIILSLLILTLAVFLYITACVIYENKHSSGRDLSPLILSEKYTKESGYAFAGVSLAAYYTFQENNNLLNQTLEAYGWSNMVKNQSILQFSGNETQTFGFIGMYTQYDIILAFQGTELTNIIEIEEDTDWQLVPFVPVDPDVYVSQGFMKAWLEVAPGIIEYITDYALIGPSTRIWVTGHSLGAAVGTLGAFQLKKDYPNNAVILYTYASPKVGDESFAVAFEEILKDTNNRVRNKLDVVPSFPFDYHVQLKTQILLTPMMSGKVQCVYNAQDPPVPTNVTTYFDNHQLTTYISFIAESYGCATI